MSRSSRSSSSTSSSTGPASALRPVVVSGSRPARNCSNWRPISSPVGIGSSAASKTSPAARRAEGVVLLLEAVHDLAHLVVATRGSGRSRPRVILRRGAQPRTGRWSAGRRSRAARAARRPPAGSPSARGSAGCARRSPWPRGPTRRAGSPAAPGRWPASAARRSTGSRPVSELGLVGVAGDRDRARVRHRHRDRAHAHHAAYAEALDDLAHRAGEGLPPGVGLGTVQQQVRRAAGVAQQPDDESRRVVVGRSGRGRRTSAGGGRGSRAARRRRRSRRPAPRPGPRGAGPRQLGGRCRRRGTRRAPAPASSSEASSRTSAGVVDDVHQRVLGHAGF